MKTTCCLLTALALCAAADSQYPQCKPGTYSCFVSINGARYAAACDAYAGPGTALNGVRSGQTGAGLACSCDNGLSLSAQKFVSASNCPRPVDLSSRAYYSGRVFPPYSTVGTANAEGQIHTPSDLVFFYMRRNCRGVYSETSGLQKCE